jgi:hypothetical protein
MSGRLFMFFIKLKKKYGKGYSAPEPGIIKLVSTNYPLPKKIKCTYREKQLITFSDIITKYICNAGDIIIVNEYVSGKKYTAAFNVSDSPNKIFPLKHDSLLEHYIIKIELLGAHDSPIDVTTEFCRYLGVHNGGIANSIFPLMMVELKKGRIIENDIIVIYAMSIITEEQMIIQIKVTPNKTIGTIIGELGAPQNPANAGVATMSP